MKLDDQIQQDLTELYRGREISAAQSLAGLINISKKGLPRHFTGDRAAKTVLVMLNPGQGVEEADKYYRCATLDYDRSCEETFIASYMTDLANYGKTDKERQDYFDIKQAAFLKAWPRSGVRLPPRFPTDRKTFLAAKEAVLMQKLQLELIPYCSREFKPNKRFMSATVPFVETLLDEIFVKKRLYVIFCAGLFEKVFAFFNQDCGETVFEMEPARRTTRPIGPGKKLKGQCRIVTIRYRGRTQRALIAHTFASQALSRACDLMARYGEFCFHKFTNS